MYPPDFIEKVQARLYARAGQWTDFAKSAAKANNAGLSIEWMVEIWLEFGLEQNQERLAEYSRWLLEDKGGYCQRQPKLSQLLDAFAKEPRLQWILEKKELHEIWIAATHIPVPNKIWRARHSVSSNAISTYLTWIQNQPDDIKIRQKEYLAKYGDEALIKTPLLYHAICAYTTPTKEQVLTAATHSGSPVYDIPRLDEYFPGFKNVCAAYEGMGMTNNDLRDRVRLFINNTEPQVEDAIPFNNFDSY